MVTKRPESQRATLSAAETPDSKPTGEPQCNQESSRRSTRPREQVVSERLKPKPTTSNEVKTLGLKSVTESGRDRDNHYELTSQNRTILRVLEWYWEVTASTRTGQPVTKPSNQPSSERKKQDSPLHTNGSRTPDKRRDSQPQRQEPPLLVRCYPSSTCGRSQSPPTRQMKALDQCQPHSPPDWLRRHQGHEPLGTPTQSGKLEEPSQCRTPCDESKSLSQTRQSNREVTGTEECGQWPLQHFERHYW